MKHIVTETKAGYNKYTTTNNVITVIKMSVDVNMVNQTIRWSDVQYYYY